MTAELTPVAWMVHSGEIWNTPICPYSGERGEPLFTKTQLQQAREDALREAADVCSSRAHENWLDPVRCDTYFTAQEAILALIGGGK